MIQCRAIQAGPHRLEDQDAALSRPKLGFESPWGHLIPGTRIPDARNLAVCRPGLDLGPAKDLRRLAIRLALPWRGRDPGILHSIDILAGLTNGSTHGLSRFHLMSWRASHSVACSACTGRRSSPLVRVEPSRADLAVGRNLHPGTVRVKPLRQRIGSASFPTKLTSASVGFVPSLVPVAGV